MQLFVGNFIITELSESYGRVIQSTIVRVNRIAVKRKIINGQSGKT